MPKLLVIERDYAARGGEARRARPAARDARQRRQGSSWKPLEEIERLKQSNGVVRGGPADGRPSLERVEHACEAILALSATTNGRLAVEGFRSLEERTGVPLVDLAGPRAGDRITLADAQVQPRT